MACATIDQRENSHKIKKVYPTTSENGEGDGERIEDRVKSATAAFGPKESSEDDRMAYLVLLQIILVPLRGY
jgi:hypothetical protein